MNPEPDPRKVRITTGKADEVHYAEYMPHASVPGELFTPIEVTGWWGCAQWSKIELICLN